MSSWFKNFIQGFHFRAKKFTRQARLKTLEINENANWWGQYQIEEEQSRYFKIGHIILCIDRFNQEWHITTYQEEDLPPLESIKSRPKSPKKIFKTFAAQTTNELTLFPTLPDRTILSKIEYPFYIPGGETLSLFISTPIWIRIEVGSPALLLDEIPTELLQKTWLSKNTLEGELCYANRNHHYSTQVEDLPENDSIVISPISIINRSKDTLLLQEINLPVPNLSIYHDNKNRLWTEHIQIYQDTYDIISTEIVKGPPKLFKDANLTILQPSRVGFKPGLRNFLSSLKW